MESNELVLDPLLHQPVRTRLVAYLASRGETTFTDLKKTLGVTDGNLEAHIKKLTAADYLLVEKRQGKGRPQTLYILSDIGMSAFRDYIDTLHKLFPGILETQGDTTTKHVNATKPTLNPT